MNRTAGCLARLASSLVVTLVGAFVVAGAAEVTPPAQIAVSPSRFEVEIGSKPTTEAVDVMNLGDEPVSIAVSVVTWDLDEGNQVRIVEPTEQTLDQWMVIIASFALLLGVVSMVQVNLAKVRRQQKGWIFSVLILVSFATFEQGRIVKLVGSFAGAFKILPGGFKTDPGDLRISYKSGEGDKSS